MAHRKIGRVVECTGLENQRTAMYRGFESLIFRKSESGAVGSAPALGAGGRRFKSCLSDAGKIVVYLLKLIPCRKSNWSHMGSSPITTTFYKVYLHTYIGVKQNQVMNCRRNAMNYRTNFTININSINASPLVETVTTFGDF